MKLNFISIIFFLVFLVSGCQTIEKKSQKVIKIENEKLSQLLQKSESNLRIVMGEPDLINENDQGSNFFIYKKKKYNITCERIFEINQNKMVIGFTSKGCF
jgi:hypothetical protein